VCWLYKIKYKANRSVDHYKAHWVAKGYSQQYSINYKETYTPIMHIKHLQLALTYAALLRLSVHQVDIIMAFLQAKLHKVIHIDQPEGFKSIKHPDYMCHLHHSLYSLKQAPLAWNLTLNKHLLSQGFIPSEADPCLYVKGQGHKIMILAIYVNDCILIADAWNIPKLKKVLSDHFEIKDLGPIKSILRIEVICNEEQGTLCLQQQGHILAILE
jgi:hypothetical protein